MLPVVLCSMLSSCFLGGGSNSTQAYDTEVATSVVSGSLNNTAGSMVGWNFMPKERPTMFARLVDAVNPVRDAWAATWTCNGGALSPTFNGATGNPYTYTPVSCNVTWANGATASARWSSTFDLSYGSSCDMTHEFIENQVGNCSVTRTTSAGGNTRSITGPDDNSYSIIHNTNGANTGWDATVSPAPSDNGVVVECATSGCSNGATLVINGSHLTGTVALGGGQPVAIWDHTLSTGSSGLTVTGSGTNRVVSGTVTVQHNILRYTATATFNNVSYNNAGCCFPTSGTVTASYNTGALAGKTETMSFSSSCGEATLTTTNGQIMAYTLAHCM
jgi:hypothetical protein